MGARARVHRALADLAGDQSRASAEYGTAFNIFKITNDPAGEREAHARSTSGEKP